MKNPNQNCLEGMQCPACKSYGPFAIAISAIAVIHDDGADNYGDTEWDGGSYCSCPDCDHDGIVSDFQTGAA
jgi:hypothetical protein